jgi:hypothetical protein
MAEAIIYAYCVTKRTTNLKTVENLIGSLYFVYHKGLFAAVSKVSADEFSAESLKSNMVDLEWVKKKVWLHEKVIEGIMKDTGVIPFKFATLFNTEESLNRYLDENFQVLRETLAKLSGKEEWGVKIYCNRGKLTDKLLKEEEDLFKLDNEIAASSAGKAFLLKKEKEQVLNRALVQKNNECGRQSYEALSAESFQECINNLLPKEVTENADDMILNAAFLVEKEKAGAFIAKVDDLKARYRDSGFYFDCTGPWPPYNFCDLSKEKVHNGSTN